MMFFQMCDAQQNMIHGVSCGWEKRMRLFGKGFRASMDANDSRKLIMRCGFARPMVLVAPIGIAWHVVEPDDTGYPIVVRGIDIEQLGTVCASLRRAKKMNLQGQGVRYDGEMRRIRTKKGKRCSVCFPSQICFQTTTKSLH